MYCLVKERQSPNLEMGITIVSIDRTDEAKPILNLDSPLDHRHYAEDYEVGSLEPREFI